MSNFICQPCKYFHHNFALKSALCFTQKMYRVEKLKLYRVCRYTFGLSWYFIRKVVASNPATVNLFRSIFYKNP